LSIVREANSNKKRTGNDQNNPDKYPFCCRIVRSVLPWRRRERPDPRSLAANGNGGPPQAPARTGWISDFLAISGQRWREKLFCRVESIHFPLE
jgi:hypothetical protein